MKKLTIFGTPISPRGLAEQLAGASFCVSYHHRRRLGPQLDQLIGLVGADDMLLVDNGAFSAWKAGGAEPFMNDAHTEAYEAWARLGVAS